VSRVAEGIGDSSVTDDTATMFDTLLNDAKRYLSASWMAGIQPCVRTRPGEKGKRARQFLPTYGDLLVRVGQLDGILALVVQPETLVPAMGFGAIRDARRQV